MEGKGNEKFDQRKKYYKPPHFKNQQRKPPSGVTKPTSMMGDEPKDPLQCWGCGEDHFLRNFPH